MPSRSDTVRLISCNLERDGGPEDSGELPTVWLEAMTKLASLNPSAILRQEMTHSPAGSRRLRAAEEILKMEGFVSPNNMGRHPTGMFLRPDVFLGAKQVPKMAPWRTPPTIVSTRFAGAPEVELLIGSVHHAFNDRRNRELEVGDATAYVDKVKGGKGLIWGGDFNEAPVPRGEIVKPIDWASPEITDRVHRVHRTVEVPHTLRTRVLHHLRRLRPGPRPRLAPRRVSCTYVDQTLLECGMHDGARYHAAMSGNRQCLGPTAGHAPGAKGQGGPQRIDRLFLDAWLTTAVINVEWIDMSGLSDHHAVLVDLSVRGMAQALRRKVNPHPNFFDLAC
ncbi:endonuclease/exonuclease/phosphatase family protein [Streptomyces sp. NPDC050428]|uniref:endonuclease/exonuclease/phosphatase family protein n=1 Tax=Streptomyces sp. NPDC050428 TaxID=3155757 RepID=UPI00341BD50A